MIVTFRKRSWNVARETASEGLAGIFAIDIDDHLMYTKTPLATIIWASASSRKPEVKACCGGASQTTSQGHL
jgi:hypothetical protein